jgi:acetyltransferase-like isoleucine patch superfamily enzyme
MRFLKIFVQALVVVMPWVLKRRILSIFFDYKIAPSARIGLSWVYPKKLVMEHGSRIGNLCTIINLDEVVFKAHSTMGRGNWVTGFPTGTASPHFSQQKERRSRLVLGKQSAITKNHHFDCTSPIEIGEFTTIAGYQSKLLTHSIDLQNNCQNSNPIKIGNYCFIGTDVVILGGAALPSYCILGAKSLLNKAFLEEWSLYAGAPAIHKCYVNQSDKYFSRLTGFVY